MRTKHVILGLHASDKADLLRRLCERAADLTGLDRASIVEAIEGRETLGSTGVGGGVALPHAHVSGLGSTLVLATRLIRPIDFGSIDKLPVDLIVFVLIPKDTGSGLAVLASLSRTLRDTQSRQRLRSAGNAEEVLATFAHVD